MRSLPDAIFFLVRLDSNTGLTHIWVMKLSLSPLAMNALLEGIQREACNLRRARDIAREYRRAAAFALRRNDPRMADVYWSEASNAWNYASSHRIELNRLQARLAAARVTSRAA